MQDITVQWESLVNLANHPWFIKLKPSQLVIAIHNLLADLIICQTFFCQTLKKTQFAKLYSHQTFLPYDMQIGSYCIIFYQNIKILHHVIYFCACNHLWIPINLNTCFFAVLHENIDTAIVIKCRKWPMSSWVLGCLDALVVISNIITQKRDG